MRPAGRHGRKPHENPETDEANKAAFLLQHFFSGVGTMLEPRSVNYEITGNKLTVAVKFKPDSGDDSGRIWWMFDRAPDGSISYLQETFPVDQWQDMKRVGDIWTVVIHLKKDATHIDFFSNHGKTMTFNGQTYQTCLSSPYTRVEFD